MLISIYSLTRQAGITVKHSIYLKLLLNASCSFNNVERKKCVFSLSPFKKAESSLVNLPICSQNSPVPLQSEDLTGCSVHQNAAIANSLVLNLTFDSSLFQINTAWQGAILISVLPRCTEVEDVMCTVCSLWEGMEALRH